MTIYNSALGLDEFFMITIDPNNPRGIVWLASYPRSGNTWTRVFLSNLLSAIEGRANTEVDLQKMALRTIIDSNVKLYEQFLGRPPAQATPEEIAALRPQTHRFLVENNEGIVLLKTHNANVAVHGIPMITHGMSAGAIYLVRNPLDVAVSAASFFSQSIDESIDQMNLSGAAKETDADSVYELRGSWSEHVGSWTAGSHPSLLVVRYEDLLERPTEAFGAIAHHVRMTFADEQLAKAIELSSFRRLSRQEEERGFGERPAFAKQFFRAGRAGQWLEVLTPAQVDRIVNAHGEQMARFGYLPEQIQNRADR